MSVTGSREEKLIELGKLLFLLGKTWKWKENKVVLSILLSSSQGQTKKINFAGNFAKGVFFHCFFRSSVITNQLLGDTRSLDQETVQVQFR